MSRVNFGAKQVSHRKCWLSPTYYKVDPFYRGLFLWLQTLKTVKRHHTHTTCTCLKEAPPKLTKLHHNSGTRRERERERDGEALEGQCLFIYLKKIFFSFSFSRYMQQDRIFLVRRTLGKVWISSPKIQGNFQFDYRCLKIHNMPPPKVSISLNVGTFNFFFFQNALNSDSGDHKQ